MVRGAGQSHDGLWRQQSGGNISALTSQRAVTLELQDSVELRALGRFLDLLAAFETAVKLRNDLAQSFRAQT